MTDHGNFKLKVCDVPVFTNLEVKLKSRTTREEANKEVERMMDAANLFEGYNWKIEECEAGGIKEFSAGLQEAIKERIGQEETEDSFFWDGMKAQYDLNVAHVLVLTDLEMALASKTKEDAVKEVAALCDAKNLFGNRTWKIFGGPDDGINAYDADLQTRIMDRLRKTEKIEDCIEGNSQPG